eukprot:gene4220-7557_t
MTCYFFESNLFSIIFGGISIIYFGKLVASLKWSNREFIYFIIFVQFFSYFNSILINIFIGRWIDDYYYNLRFNGMISLHIAFTLILKRENNNVFSTNSIYGRNFHLFSILFNFMYVIIISKEYTQILLSLFGISFGWIFLRFYIKNDDGTIGFKEDSFSFSSFFPSNISVWIDIIISSPIYLVLNQIGILTIRKSEMIIKIENEENISILGSSNETAKKRREFANSEIDSKLALTEEKVENVSEII